MAEQQNTNSTPTLEALLAAGVHFGHQTRRWNPKMRRFIFAERNGIHIIDLQKTLRQIELAQKLAREVILRGENVLFVCTKPQLAGIVKAEAARAGALFITERWLGGLLTNWVTVQKSVKRLQELDEMATDGRYDLLPKKEVIKLERERKHLQANLAGIKTLRRLPDALFVIDSNNEQIAVKEARKLGIPVVAVVDTNCDPTEVDYVIPGNDDALRAIRLFASKVADSIVEGAQAAEKTEDAELAGAAADHAPAGEGSEPSEYAADGDSGSDEINLEEVLGGNIRKSPAVAAAAATESEAEAAVE